MCTTRPERPWAATCRHAGLVLLAASFWFLTPLQPAVGQDVIQKIEKANDRVELTVNSSRILTLDKKIPRAQVNNPELLTLTPLSPNQVQISAKSAGVTQVNLWDETGKVFSIDVLIYGDVKELEMALQMLFPHSSVKVYRYSNSLVLTGYVDRPDHLSRITRLAEDYSPKVINNISVGGAQQILLHVKVMEVSRSKLRTLGFDFASFSGGGDIISSISGLISSATSSTVTGSGDATLNFSLVDGNSAFFGFLEALRQYEMLKILAEPTMVTVSGRPASFNVGGEFPILVPQSLGTISIEFKKYGTQVDFVPIVLGNGNIRLEVRPRVSDVDRALGTTLPDGTFIPALKVREVDTGVEMKAGQTLALAGLIQSRVESENRGIPILADLPWVGAGFRRVEEKANEIELLILVRPEFAAALDPHEVPPGGPGLDTTTPTDCELYLRGYIEVPRCGTGGDCQECRDGAAEGSETVEPLAPAAAAGAAADPALPSSRRLLSQTQAWHKPQNPTRNGTAPANTYNRANASLRSVTAAGGDAAVAEDGDPDALGLIGPLGYDVEK